MTEAKATFDAGCFWGVEAVFRRLDGITATAVGFAGGNTDNPSYEQVSHERTGHAEVVEVTYDPEHVPYEQLLAVFWARHDPTQRNRPGPNIGDQDRTVVLVQHAEQRAAAEASRDRLQKRLSCPVVTQIEDAPTFWPAEDYHQRYLEKRGFASCNLALVHYHQASKEARKARAARSTSGPP